MPKLDWRSILCPTGAGAKAEGRAAEEGKRGVSLPGCILPATSSCSLGTCLANTCVLFYRPQPVLQSHFFFLITFRMRAFTISCDSKFPKWVLVNFPTKTWPVLALQNCHTMFSFGTSSALHLTGQWVACPMISVIMCTVLFYWLDCTTFKGMSGKETCHRYRIKLSVLEADAHLSFTAWPLGLNEIILKGHLASGKPKWDGKWGNH